MLKLIILLTLFGALSTCVLPSLGFPNGYLAWIAAMSPADDALTSCGGAGRGASRVDLPFNPGDRVTIALPGTVRYRPGGRAEAIVSGDPAVVEHVRFENGRLGLDCRVSGDWSKLDVDITAPAIAAWDLTSSATLTLTDIAQPALQLTIRGSGNVVADGAVDSLKLKIASSGNLKAAKLAAKSAEVEIRGSGNALVAAEQDADVAIYGSGSVKLYGNAVLRRSEERGSGRISRADP